MFLFDVLAFLSRSLLYTFGFRLVRAAKKVVLKHTMKIYVVYFELTFTIHLSESI